MKKMNLLLAFVASAGLLAGCNQNSKQYFGFGAVSHFEEFAKSAAKGYDIETTVDYVSVVVNKKGVISNLRLDTTQIKVEGKVTEVEDGDDVLSTVIKSKVFGTEENPSDDIKSKWDLLGDYGMAGKVPGTIGKEWYEQAAKFEEWAVGKTVEQVKAGIANDKLTDGATIGVTITVDAWVSALDVALESKVQIKGKVAGLGVGSLNEHDALQDNFYVAGAAFDADKKVLGSRVDTFQVPYVVSAEGLATINKAATKKQVVASENRIKGKQELKADYGMTNASPIKKEWFEQAQSLADYLVGKKISDALGTSAKLENGAEIGVTVTVSGYRSVLSEAEYTAFNDRVAS